MAGNIRDGTVLTCLAGKEMKTGRAGTVKKKEIIVAWMGRDGGCEFP